MLEYKITSVIEGDLNLDNSPQKGTTYYNLVEEQKEKAANERKKIREKLTEEMNKIKRDLKLLRDDFTFEVDRQKEINGNKYLN